MDNSIFIVECLKTDLEKKLRRSLVSPSDFKFLSLQIQMQCNEQISSHTLMRIWGYIRSNSKPSIHTLSILCRFLGYNSLSHYSLALNIKKSEGSAFIETDILSVDMMEPNDRVTLKWNPNRCVTLLYLDKFKFRVISNTNSSLKIGDVFQCVSFAKGIPFVASFDMNETGVRKSYIAGKQGGLTSISLYRGSGAVANEVSGDKKE